MKKNLWARLLQEKRLLTHVIHSNVIEVVEQGQYIFNTFWNKAIPARQRIREIEEGTKREYIETIQDPSDIKKLVFKLMESAAQEILAIFPTVKTVERYRHEGVREFLNKAATQRNVSIRVLAVSDHESKGQDQKLSIRYLRAPPHYAK